jgi:hypothetical protein
MSDTIETDELVRKLEVAGWRVRKGGWPQTEAAKASWDFCRKGQDLFAMTEKAREVMEGFWEGRPIQRRLDE